MNFYQGDAESFVTNCSAIKEKTFDLVINVESSHCYGNIKNFVKQVSKVLKQDGVFCITDFRKRKHFKQLEQDLQSHDLKIVDKKDITINVIQSLKLDE